MDLVSVIVPVYNVEQYLDRCISSIVNQTYHNLEIILIDDGSSDGSSEICDQWACKDKRIRVIHQTNSGVSVARNIGIENVKGRYVLMADSDDYLSDNAVAVLYNALVKNNADLAICDFEKGSDEDYIFKTSDDNTVDIIDNHRALMNIYENNTSALRFVAPWGKLYKAELFEGIRYPEGKIFEDIYVTHELLYQCDKIAVVAQKLVYYFQHSDSIMNARFHIGKLDYLEAMSERIDFFRQHELHDLKDIAYDEYLHALIWEYSRARDLLGNREAMKDIKRRFRAVYVNGYANKRYPKENAVFLAAFRINPELIILFWRFSGKWNKLFKKE